MRREAGREKEREQRGVTERHRQIKRGIEGTLTETQCTPAILTNMNASTYMYTKMEQLRL